MQNDWDTQYQYFYHLHITHISEYISFLFTETKYIMLLNFIPSFCLTIQVYLYILVLEIHIVHTQPNLAQKYTTLLPFFFLLETLNAPVISSLTLSIQVLHHIQSIPITYTIQNPTLVILELLPSFIYSHRPYITAYTLTHENLKLIHSTQTVKPELNQSTVLQILQQNYQTFSSPFIFLYYHKETT